MVDAPHTMWDEDQGDNPLNYTLGFRQAQELRACHRWQDYCMARRARCGVGLLPCLGKRPFFNVPLHEPLACGDFAWHMSPPPVPRA